MCELKSKHLAFCVEEMLAEVGAELESNEFVRALVQLEEREARGEVLDVVCAKALRAYLEREISRLPATRARHKLMELERIIESPMSDASPTAEPVVIDKSSNNNVVIDCIAYRAAAPVPRSEWSAPLPSSPRPYQQRHRPAASGLARGIAIVATVILVWTVSPQLVLQPGSIDLSAIAAPSLVEIQPLHGGLTAASP